VSVGVLDLDTSLRGVYVFSLYISILHTFSSSSGLDCAYVLACLEYLIYCHTLAWVMATALSKLMLHDGSLADQ